MQPKRILVVDDDAGIVKILFDFLTFKYSADVTGASDGVEAMSRIAENRAFDLIITDFQMPKADGIKVYEFVEKRRLRAHILLMSGMDGLLRELEKLREAGKNVPLPDRTIKKPFTLLELFAKINSLPNV